MFGGGGMNPRKMKQMMEQMGIDVEELDAEEVVVRTADEELVFEAPQVTRMDAQGQQTYQVIGDPERRERGAGEANDAEADDGGTDDASAGDVPDSDVRIVAQRTGASEDDARAALAAEDGDLAAVSRLE
jgi:nascent polypeptide-associated complex subunit alpha